jgi:tetratricopeptide (TPR) repeat protein
MLTWPAGGVRRLVRSARRDPRAAALRAAVVVLLVAASLSTAYAVRKSRQAREAAAARDAAQALAQFFKAAHAEEDQRRQQSEERNRFVRSSLERLAVRTQADLAGSFDRPDLQRAVLRSLRQTLLNVVHSDRLRLTDRALADSYLAVGDLLDRQGDPLGAADHFTAGRVAAQRWESAEPVEKDSAAARIALLTRRLADATLRVGPDHLQPAVELYRYALVQQQAILTRPRSGECPVSSSKLALADTYGRLGKAHAARGEITLALDCCREAVALRGQVLREPEDEDAPAGEAVRHALAGSYRDLCLVEMAANHPDAARAAGSASLALWTESAHAHPDSLLIQQELAGVLRLCGDLARTGPRPAEARAYYERAAELHRRLLATPEVLDRQWELAETLHRAAAEARRAGDPASADRLARECLELRRTYVTRRLSALPEQVRALTAQVRGGRYAEACETAGRLWQAVIGTEPSSALVPLVRAIIP